MTPAPNILSILSVALLSLTQPAYSGEGDITQTIGGTCYTERAGGLKEITDCPKFGPKLLSEQDKAGIVELLGNFENSQELNLVTQLSNDMKAEKISKREVYKKHSKGVLRQALKMDNGKFLVKIVFVNDSDFPNKSKEINKYYTSGERSFNWISSEQTAELDNAVSTWFIGENHGQYQTVVNSISKNNVGLTLSLDDSSPLSDIIEGKQIKSIDHAGMPFVEYEEIEPKTFKN